MRALGAELQIVRSDNKRITADLVETMIETSRKLSLTSSKRLRSRIFPHHVNSHEVLFAVG